MVTRFHQLWRVGRLASKRCLRMEGRRTYSTESNLMRYFKGRIKAGGPISVAHYMQEVLTNPDSGYYMNRDVFGQKGDFITSPEISQMFGEMLGIWCMNEWTQKKQPKEIKVVEFGPGRGTLADDMLRILTQFPAMKDAVSFHLVEISPTLSRIQAEKLSGKSLEKIDRSDDVPYMSVTSKYGPQVHWYKTLKDVPTGFSCYIAHEFFDALPIYKFQKTDRGWREVLIDVDAEQHKELEAGVNLRFVIAPGVTIPVAGYLTHISHNEKRDHIEVCPDAGVIVEEIATRIKKDGGMALLADYGHDGEKTDTFRGFKNHQLHDVLKDPGTADLTADVDFSYLRHVASKYVRTYGPVTQKDFLNNMGIMVRLQILLQNSPSSEVSRDLLSGCDMLINEKQMGERFKFFAMMPKNDEKDYKPAGFKPLF